MKCKKVFKNMILTFLMILCINIIAPSYINTISTPKEHKIGIVYADAVMKGDGITPQKIKVDSKPDKEKAKEEKEKAKEAINNIEGAGKFEKIIANLIISFICGFTSFINSQTEFSTLDNIVFNKGLSVDGYSPIIKADWANMDKWFGYSTAIACFLIVIATVAIALKFFRASYNAHYKQEAKDSLVRLLIASIIIAATPLFIRLLIYINNELTYLFYNLLNDGKVTLDATLGGANLIKSLDVDSPLAAATLYGMFSFLGIKINIVFLIRYFSIIVYYVLTPIVAVLWIIDKNINGAQVWLGEMLSNIFMQSAYALLFSLYLVFVAKHSWAAQLIWAILIVTLADIVRNMLQGTLTKMAGMDENKKANGILGAVGATTGIVAGVAASFSNQAKSIASTMTNKPTTNNGDNQATQSTGFIRAAKKVSKGATGVVGNVAKLSSIPAVLNSSNPNATANMINRSIDSTENIINDGIDSIGDVTNKATEAYKSYSSNYSEQKGYDPNKNIFENAYDSMKKSKHLDSFTSNKNNTNNQSNTEEKAKQSFTPNKQSFTPNKQSFTSNRQSFNPGDQNFKQKNNNHKNKTNFPNFDSKSYKG